MATKNETVATKKVVVITRTKDRNLLLERAIKSVHNQTMTDFIHVIINDGGNKEAVNKLVEKYKNLITGRIKVIHNSSSLGMEAASNKAIRSEDSTYIAIHDDDDSWHPDFLKKTTEHLNNTGAMGVVVTTDRVTEKIEGDKIKIISVDRLFPGVNEVSLFKQCIDNYVTPITFLYRRRALSKVGYYDESLPVNGDWDFGLRFLQEYDIDFLEVEPSLAYYHHRPATEGPDGNSVFAGRNLHRRNMNRLANRYLREDLAAGRLGVGYIVNYLRYKREKDNIIDNLTHNIWQLQVKVAGVEQQVKNLNFQLNESESRLTHLVTSRTSYRSKVKKLLKLPKRIVDRFIRGK